MANNNTPTPLNEGPNPILVQGAFFESLKRNNKEIKNDRAQALSEDTEILMKRKVEDLGLSISRMKRQQENMLDMSPNNTTSLILASNFNADDYVEKDLALGLEIRNTEIKLEIAQKRYLYLFGKQI